MTVQEIIKLLQPNPPFYSCIKYQDGSVSGYYPQWGAVDSNNEKLNVAKVELTRGFMGLTVEIYTGNIKQC